MLQNLAMKIHGEDLLFIPYGYFSIFSQNPAFCQNYVSSLPWKSLEIQASPEWNATFLFCKLEKKSCGFFEFYQNNFKEYSRIENLLQYFINLKLITIFYKFSLKCNDAVLQKQQCIDVGKYTSCQFLLLSLFPLVMTIKRLSGYFFSTFAK